MQKPIRLTEEQRNTLANCLEVAAVRFLQNVSELGYDHRHHWLVDQFKRQTEKSNALADLLNNAEYIELGPQVE